MTDGLYALCIVGADTTTEQEGRPSTIGLEHAPVELLTIATHTLTFSIKEEVIYQSLVGDAGCEVVSSGNVEGLDN